MDRLFSYEIDGEEVSVAGSDIRKFRATPEFQRAVPLADFDLDGETVTVARADVPKLMARHPQAKELDVLDDGGEEVEFLRADRAKFVSSQQGARRGAAARLLTPLSREALPRKSVVGAAAAGAGEGLARGARDLGATALQGLVNAQGAAVGLLNYPTGGYAGKLMEGLGWDQASGSRWVDTLRSEEMRDVREKVAQSEGFLGRTGAALRHPSTIVHNTLESLPTMAAGGQVARVLAPVLGIAPAAAGGLGEGIMQAGSALEDARSQMPGGLVGPRQMLASAASGAMAGMIVAIGGKLSERLGTADVDTILAGGGSPAQRSMLSRVLAGAVSEGLFEEVPQSMTDQMMANVAVGRPMWEGVQEAGAEGGLSGALMGGAGNLSPTRSNRATGARQKQGIEGAQVVAPAVPDAGVVAPVVPDAGVVAPVVPGGAQEGAQGTVLEAARAFAERAAVASAADLDAIVAALDASTLETGGGSRTRADGRVIRLGTAQRLPVTFRRSKDGTVSVREGTVGRAASPESIFQELVAAGADAQESALAVRRRFGDDFAGPYGLDSRFDPQRTDAVSARPFSAELANQIRRAGGIRTEDAGDATLAGLPRDLRWSKAKRTSNGKVKPGYTLDELVTALDPAVLPELGLDPNGTISPDELANALASVDWTLADPAAAANAEWRKEQSRSEDAEAAEQAAVARAMAEDAEAWDAWDFGAAERALDAAAEQEAEEWARRSLDTQPDLNPETWTVGDVVPIRGSEYEVEGFEADVVTLRRATGERVYLSLVDLNLVADDNTLNEGADYEGIDSEGVATGPEPDVGIALAAQAPDAAQTEAVGSEARGGAEGGAEGVAPRQGAVPTETKKTVGGVAAEYGYSVNEAGDIFTPSGKDTGAVVDSPKGGRYRVRTKSTGKMLFSFPASNVSAFGSFLEQFWYAKKAPPAPADAVPAQGESTPGRTTPGEGARQGTDGTAKPAAPPKETADRSIILDAVADATAIMKAWAKRRAAATGRSIRVTRREVRKNDDAWIEYRVDGETFRRDGLRMTLPVDIDAEHWNMAVGPDSPYRMKAMAPAATPAVQGAAMPSAEAAPHRIDTIIEPAKGEVIPYQRDLRITNLDALPRGTGARYLEVIRGQAGELVAKQWRRQPVKDAVLVDMKPAPPAPADAVPAQGESTPGRVEPGEGARQGTDGGAYMAALPSVRVGDAKAVTPEQDAAYDRVVNGMPSSYNPPSMESNPLTASELLRELESRPRSIEPGSVGGFIRDKSTRAHDAEARGLVSINRLSELTGYPPEILFKVVPAQERHHVGAGMHLSDYYAYPLTSIERFALERVTPESKDVAGLVHSITSLRALERKVVQFEQEERSKSTASEDKALNDANDAVRKFDAQFFASLDPSMDSRARNVATNNHYKGDERRKLKQDVDSLKSRIANQEYKRAKDAAQTRILQYIESRIRRIVDELNQLPAQAPAPAPAEADGGAYMAALPSVRVGDAAEALIGASQPPAATDPVQAPPLPSVRRGPQSAPRLGMDLPAAVELYRQLSEGKLPKVVRSIQALGGRALGVFRHRGDGKPENRSVDLRADIFNVVDPASRMRFQAEADAEAAKQAAETGMDPDDQMVLAHQLYVQKVEAEFQANKDQEPAVAISTLLHEIGHWVDDIPDGLRGRGNIFGHIAALKKYTQGVLEQAPGEGPGAITAEDKAAMRRKAKDLIGPQGKDSWRDYNRRLNRETKRMIEAETERRGLVPLKTLRAELEGLLAWYHGMDAMPEYFEAPKEMFADAFGAWLNHPAEVAARAPVFDRMMGEWLAARPEARKAYLAVQDELRKGLDLSEEWDRIAAAQRAESERATRMAEQQARNTGQEFLDNLMSYVGRVLQPIYRRFKTLPAGGSDAAMQALNNMRWSRSYTELLGTEWVNRVRRPLERAGLRIEDLNVYATARRVAHEGVDALANEERTSGRANLANPGGLSRPRALAMLEEMQRRNPQAFATLDAAWKAQRAIREQYVFPALQRDGVLSQEQYEMMVENWAYGRFQVGQESKGILDGIVGGGDTPGGKIHRQIGTLKPIGGVAENTLLFDMAFVRWADAQAAKRLTMEALASTDPEHREIMEAEYVFDAQARKLVPKDVNTARVKTVYYVEGGKLKGWYVPTSIWHGLERSPNNGSELVLNWVAKFVTAQSQALTTRNIGFSMRNPIRDIRRASRELPGLNYWPVIGNPRVLAMTIANVPASFRRARGLSDPKVTKALGRYMLPSGDLWTAKDAYSDHLSSDLAKRGITSYADARNSFGRVWKSIADNAVLLFRMSQWNETAVKLGAMDYLDRYYPGMSELEKQRMIQKHAGTPDIYEQSLLHRNPMFRMASLFYNVNKEAILARVETWRDRPVEQLFKFAMDSPGTFVGWASKTGLLLAAADWLLKAVYGDDEEDDPQERGMARTILEGFKRYAAELQRMYASIPWREVVLYNAIPLGWENEQAKTVRLLRFVDDQSTAAERAGLFIGLAAAQGKASFGNFLDLGVGELTPGISPVLNILMGISGYDVSGGFRPIIQDRGQLGSPLGRRKAVAQYAKWIANQMTGNTFGLYRWRDEDELLQPAPGAWQEWLKKPGIPTLANSFVRVTRSGLEEDVRKIMDEQRARDWEERVVIDTYATAWISGEEQDEDNMTLLSQIPNVRERITRAIQKATLRREYDSFTRELDNLPGTADPAVRAMLEANLRRIEGKLATPDK